jgi:hypothetical protein
MIASEIHSPLLDNKHLIVEEIGRSYVGHNGPKVGSEGVDHYGRRIDYG